MNLRWRLGLRWTLLLALLPLLTLPWIGLRFVERMAELARDERLENQATSARALAASLHERRELFETGAEPARLPAGAQTLPVENVPANGRAWPDWRLLPWRELPVQTNPASPANLFHVRVAAARFDAQPERLLLAIEIDDERYVPAPPGTDSSTVLAAEGSVAPTDALIVEAGASADALVAQRIQVFEREGGWRTELTIVGAPPALLRIRAQDVDYLGTRRIEAVCDSGLLAPTAPPRVDGDTIEGLRQQALWADTIRALERVSGRVSIYDAHGALRAQRGSLAAAPIEPDGWQARLAQMLLSAAVGIRPEAAAPNDGGDNPLLSPLARALAGAPAQQSHRIGVQAGMPAWILTSAHPIWVEDRIVGALVLEENTAARLVLGQAALERLTLLAALAVAASVMALLLVASITVGRVVRLRNEAETAIDPRGRVLHTIRESALADELGDLRSSYARVLARLREHQEYLANLRSRLVHELRTPIMVVRSSLENLSAETDPGLRDAYIGRVQAGAARLERILGSMGEASSLETMLADSEMEEVDLRKLMAACTDGYRSAFAPREFELRSEADPALCSGVPEAIAQALDKLVSNAIDFALPGTPIVVTLSAVRRAQLPPEAGRAKMPGRWWPRRWRTDDRAASPGHRPDAFWQIAVRNEGPSLPRNMGESLLDQMVSVRGDRQSEQTHLGLGLYLVRLIAEFHGGEAFARNVLGGVEAGFTLRSGGGFGPAISATHSAT
ncbi:MAG: ATP-binding protein [Burkholderiaceae bacterium]